jgi:hypothetical protein
MELDTNIIETELVKSNLTNQVISKMKEDYLGLVVKDVYDKPGFEAVSTARKEAKKFRVAVEKCLKAVREPAVAFQRAVVAKEKEIVGQVKEIEEYLTLQEEVFTRKEAELVLPLSDTEKIASFAKALLTVKPPELETIDGKEKLLKITNLLVEIGKIAQ